MLYTVQGNAINENAGATSVYLGFSHSVYVYIWLCLDGPILSIFGCCIDTEESTVLNMYL